MWLGAHDHDVPQLMEENMAHLCIGHPGLPCPECEAEGEICLEAERQEPQKEPRRTNCQVCGFNFGEDYGDHGEGFIEVTTCCRAS